MICEFGMFCAEVDVMVRWYGNLSYFLCFLSDVTSFRGKHIRNSFFIFDRLILRSLYRLLLFLVLDLENSLNGV